MQEPIPGADLLVPSGFGPVGRTLRTLSQWLAVAGGLVFIALVSMSLVSIVGRKLASAPVPGDVEILQTCAAFASAAFFAWCHLNRGDVKVDFFTQKLPPRVVGLLDCVGSLLVAVFGAVLSWRTFAGAMSVKEAGETTAILGWPLWVGQVLMVPGFVMLALAGLYMAGFHLRRQERPAATP